MKIGWFVLLMLVAVCPACDYTDALLKDGAIIRKKIALEHYEQIEIETSVQLVLTNDTASVAVLEGLDFLVPRLVLKQEGKVLRIESNGLIGFREKQLPSLTLGVSGLKRITSNFPSKITNKDTLEMKYLQIVVNGRGTFTQCNLLVDAGEISLSAYGSNVGNHIFRGRVDKFTVQTEGLTTVDALDLEAKTVRVVQKSVNASFVKALEYLSVDMFASGDVFYKGNPETSIRMGEPLYEVELGEVVHLDE